MHLAVIAGLFGSSVFAAAFAFGLRHGVDWDHIAALSDLTNGQPSPRRSMSLATAYALGHAAVVVLLGGVAILLGAEIPAPLDAAMQRVVGATLLVLAVYVIVTLIRDRGTTSPRSRWMLVLDALQHLRGRRTRADVVIVEHDHAHDHDDHDHDHDHDHGHMHPPELDGDDTESRPSSVKVGHRHPHRHVGRMPADPFTSPGLRAAAGIGVLHGIGAETPTQVLLFATAAGAGGRAASVAILVCFVAGLLCSNSVLALAAAYGYLGARANRAVLVVLSLVTAAFSLAVGLMLLTGQAAALPGILGG